MYRLLLMTMTLLLAAFRFDAGQAVADDAEIYRSQVRHVLHERCVACHGALKQEGGLRLDTGMQAVRGGESGPAITPSRPDASLLMERITASDLSVRMPPEGEALKPQEIVSLRKWIEQGAISPADEEPESDPRDHWAFRVPVRPEVPSFENHEWAVNPIDGFIASVHEKKGLKAQPSADRLVWLRRVTLDLTGLPPALEAQQAFLNDHSPEAWEKVVDRLLASPQYGERWGRHWMDIWRYSDWWGLGAEVRNSQKHIWHWRDWIIESLNDDKGYDQMLREMLAADELYPDDLKTLRASGFLARQYFKFNRTSWLDETIEHSSKAMLGMTFNCAKCHDHKYDPFSQREYYELRAIFEPYQIRTDAVAGELDFEKNGVPRAFDCNPDATTFLHVRGDDRNPDQSRPLSPGVPAFLTSAEFRVEQISLPPEAHEPGLRSHVVETHLKAAADRIESAKGALQAARQKLEESQKAEQARDAEAGPVEETAEILASDNFEVERPEMWKQDGGQWAWENGKLVQSQTGTARAALRLLRAPPADFEATLKYTPTGGDMWKSVGIRFDGAATDGDEVMVYLSSYAGGPKAQVSYLHKGQQVYPADGAQARPVNLNVPHELKIRVRDRLINVIVDGQPSVAWRLPIARRPGLLELIAFDAKAEFHSFVLSTLPASVRMTEASGNTSEMMLTAEQATLAVTVAEKSLLRAEAEPASILARAQATRARVERPEDPATQELVAAAVRAERVVLAAKAEEDLAAAKLAVSKAAPEGKAAAAEKAAALETAAQTAIAAVDMPGENFSPLVGALKTLENNLESEDSRRRPFPKFSTGRRAAYARWITDPQNPLPARVAVNHLWARHFGKGLVSTVFDFGRKGSPPTHPELLDWLAVEFVEHGWSMKHLHRLIVLSGTYRMSSTVRGADSETVRIDGDNRFYWRRNPVRMEAQVIRDSLLSLAGQIDLTMGGPSIPVADEKSRRRSLYFVHSHNEHQKFLSIFDDANVLECYRRSESIVPQQALALENSSLAREMAERIVEQLEGPGHSLGDEDFVKQAFRRILTVEATPDELTTSLEALSLLAAAANPQAASPQKQARVNLVQALLNHNDFVTIR